MRIARDKTLIIIVAACNVSNGKNVSNLTAIVIRVLPLNASLEHCKNCFSVSESRLDVASSRTKQMDPLRTARAKQKSCL
jgi:hypothetical protein